MIKSHRIFKNITFVALPWLAALLLTACQTGGGYTQIRAWDYNNQPQAREALHPPKSLSEIYEEKQRKAAESAALKLKALENEILAANETIIERPSMASPHPPVKVALLLPLSGQHSALGQSMLKAAQIALFDVGHNNFELLPQDTKGTTKGAREATQEALKEGAQLILGPVFSKNVRAAKMIARKRNVNIIAFSTDWGLAGDNTFIMGFLPFDQVERITQYAAKRNLGRMAVIAPNSDYGRAVISTYTAVASQNALETTDIKTFATNTGNLSPTLRKFTKYDERMTQIELAKAQGQSAPALTETLPFEAVLMPVGGESAISISNLLSHYDLPPHSVKRLGTGLFDDLSLASEESLNGAWFAAPSPYLRRDFEGRFNALYNRRAPRLASLAYDATALAAVLADRGLTSSNKPAFDRQSITNPNGFSGIDGIFRFRPDGTAERGLAILEFKKGRFIVIDQAPKTFQQGSKI